MKYKSVFEEILQELEKSRDIARWNMKEKKQKIYDEIPKLAEIDSKIKQLTLRISIDISSGKNDPQEAIPRLQKESEALLREKENLLVLKGYTSEDLKEKFSCKFCSDTGFVGYEKCICLKKRLIQKHYENSNMLSTLTKENFNIFNEGYYSDIEDEDEGISPRKKILLIRKNSIDFINMFVKNNGKSGKNLLFYGSTGLGKTFLSKCIGKEILDKGFTVLYLPVAILFRVLEDFRFNRKEMVEAEETVNELTEVDLLIIDDLGTEVSTLVTSSELFNILNQRCLDNRSTMISTNLKPAQLEKIYSERLISRLFGYYQMIKFVGSDIRVHIKYS